MEEKKSTNPQTQNNPTPHTPLLLSSVIACLIITFLYFREQFNSDKTFGSERSFYPSLLLFPAIFFAAAKKNSSPPPKPAAIPSEKHPLLPADSPISSDPLISIIPIESTTDDKIAQSRESKLSNPSSPSRIQRMCKALQDGADLLPSIFLVQSCLGLVQNVLVETGNNQLYTFSVVTGLAVGAMINITLNTVDVYKIGLTSEIENDQPEKGRIYISVEGNILKYTMMDIHGEVHSDIPIPQDKLNTSIFPDPERYPKLFRAALAEHLPTILETTSKNGHTPNDPKLRRSLETLISHTRNHILLALQFVLSTVMRRRLPAIKGTFDACMSSVFTGYNWTEFVRKLLVKAKAEYIDTPSTSRSPATSIVDRPEGLPIQVFTCPQLILDGIQVLGGAALIGSAIYIKLKEFSDPERLIEWSAYWLDSIGGYFVGAGIGGPLARLISSYIPNHRNKFSTLSNYLIVFLISPNLTTLPDILVYTSLIVIAAIFCRITQEITQEDLTSQLYKRAKRKQQIENLFNTHRYTQHMRGLLDVLDTPDYGPILKPHKKQYLALKKHLFNAVFFSYMVYKIASIYPAWKNNDQQNAWIDITTAFSIASMLLGFNFVLPKFRPAPDSLEFLQGWSWKKIVYDPNFALVFMSNVAFKIQGNEKFAKHMSLVANTVVGDALILLLVGKAANVYEIEIGGLETLRQEDIDAFRDRLLQGHGKINRLLAQYFKDTYIPRLKEITDSADEEDKKKPTTSISEDKVKPHRLDSKASPLLKSGFFKKSSQELKNPAAATSADCIYEVIFDKKRSAVSEFEQSALSGTIRGADIKGNLSRG